MGPSSHIPQHTPDTLTRSTGRLVSSNTLSHLTRLLIVLPIALSMALACDPPQKRAEDLNPNLNASKKPAKVSINPSSRLSEQDQRIPLAIINKELITLGEYERRLNDQPPFARSRYNTIERKREFLDDLIQFEILADEAEKQGYATHPDVVLNLKQSMVRKMMADHIAKTVSVSDITEKEIRDYYDAHQNDYVRPEKIRTSQIVVPDEETAKQVIADLEAQFAKDPTHKRKIFQRKVREVSTDKATAERGGDMNFYPRPEEGGTVPKALTDAAFTMKNVEQMVGPIQTEAGWHLLMLMGRKQRYERSFEDAERSIANRLYREKRVIAEKKYIEEAKKGAAIEIKTELLEKIPDPEPDKNAPKPGAHDDHHGGK